MLLPNPVPSHPTYSTTIQYPSKDFGFGIGIGIVKKRTCGTEEVAMTELLVTIRGTGKTPGTSS